MLRFDIFSNPMYLIFFSNIEEESLKESEIEEESQKNTLEILIEKLAEESILGNYSLIEGIARLKLFLENSDFNEEKEEKPVTDKKLVMSLNQFSIFKGIIDFI
ncbi:molybdopterin converting factor small subunit [Fusobacterium sp. PH5-7]|uniref:hypothetical protein n=1 Tax=Fusobacterium sp. PH5-7 TaxID=2940528 RepID=UPI0024735BE2|nr:hypothetical protein [Fusobacterium sp. PH5-7]MDH6458253.1 molybdopterin converting factor small subunit [Fusobacterium sp. PH5-7]